MSEPMTLPVTTYLFGLGAERKAPPVYILLEERTTTARALIEEHVRAEVERSHSNRSASLALHYMLSDNIRQQPTPTLHTLDLAAETARAYAGLTARRYVLVVDGVAIHDLDAPLTLTKRSVVCFVRLLPLIGG